MNANKLMSWGRYPYFPQTPHFCDVREDVPNQLTSIIANSSTTLAYGNGRSYGDSCMAASDHVIYTRPLHRLLRIDFELGIFVAEAGMTLGEVLEFAVPNGWFLPVTPGTKFITLGGAIANDVHGKNHHLRGTFGRYIRSFGLVRSDHGYLKCSPLENRDLFLATIGGLGLTGIIDLVEIQLVKINGTQIDETRQRFGSLAEFFDISAEQDIKHEFCVSWIDSTAKGAHAGRGIYMGGNFTTDGKMGLEKSRAFTLTVTPPFSLVNRFSARIFNELYWHKQSKHRLKARIGYEPFFYPLDGLLKWNRIYGSKGFRQYQCAIPERDAQSVLLAMLKVIANSGVGSFLGVIKRFGDIPSPGLISFPMRGTTFALDFLQMNILEPKLFQNLDAIIGEAGGRLYPAKDSHMSGRDFRRGYPAWEQVEALRDPALMSRFWKRVTT
jgi:FAD/FMN-containing dehydrogenase